MPFDWLRSRRTGSAGSTPRSGPDRLSSFSEPSTERRWLFADWWLRALTELGATDDNAASRAAGAALAASDAGRDEKAIERLARNAIVGTFKPPLLSGGDMELIIFARHYANARRAGADRERAQAIAIDEHVRLKAETRAKLDAHLASRSSGGATPAAPSAPSASSTPGSSLSLREAEDLVVEVARRTVPAPKTPSHFFIVSGNRSLIKAYHDLFRVGAPTYGGSATIYRGDAGTLQARQDESGARAIRFNGQRSMGVRTEASADVAAVLGSVRVQSASGGVFVAHVSVGPNGRAWVRDVYTTVMKDAVGQGILPYPMYETDDSEAASYLLESLTAESVS